MPLVINKQYDRGSWWGYGLKGIEYRTYLPSWSLITSDVEGRILLVSLSFFASSIFFMVQEVF
jgi:hypothetical protein